MGHDRITCAIADDHAVLRRGLAAYLRAEPDIDVIGEAADGAEALAMAQRRHPDVLVLDVLMGATDGIGTCAKIVAAGLPTRVVLYTGCDDLERLEAALEAGAAGYVVKSGPPDELLRAMRTGGTGRVYVDASLAGALIRRREAPKRALLSPREAEVLALLAEGHTTDEAAGRLFLAPSTVRSYTESAMQKVQARNRAHLIAKSLRMGLLS